MEEEVKQEETPEQKADKETKKYLGVLEVIKTVVGGEENLRPIKKVDSDETASLVAELFKEEEGVLRIKVKEGLKNLLKQHVEMESEISKKRKELDSLQIEKRKEFTKAANAWLQQVDQQGIKLQSYGDVLKTAFLKEENK